MELRLENIGMIKEANVELNGLTVIAGENDTGKSTVGKALFMMLRSAQKGFTEQVRNDYEQIQRDSLVLNIGYLMSKVFKRSSLQQDGYISLKTKNQFYSVKRFDRFVAPDSIGEEIIGGPNEEEKDVIFIETPLIWNLFSLFSQIPKLESAMKIFVEYPYLLRDLYLKLSFKGDEKGIDISDKVISLMQGKFDKDDKDDMYFYKDGQRIELLNTATGVKMLGIFQVLSQNNYLNEDTVLVLDEPEVHLHPKWQLEMAKIIVELVENGVTILLNSHSPYMIEALKRYAERAGIENKTNFYLAEDGYIKQIEESNSVTLSKIFEKLSEPFDVFDEMDSQRMEKLIHG